MVMAFKALELGMVKNVKAFCRLAKQARFLDVRFRLAADFQISRLQTFNVELRGSAAVCETPLERRFSEVIGLLLQIARKSLKKFRYKSITWMVFLERSRKHSANPC